MEDLRPQTELLCKSFPVIHRSNQDVQKRQAFVRLNYKQDGLVIDFSGRLSTGAAAPGASSPGTSPTNNNSRKSATNSEDEIRIPLKCIQNLRPKDFTNTTPDVVGGGGLAGIGGITASSSSPDNADANFVDETRRDKFILSFEDKSAAFAQAKQAMDSADVGTTRDAVVGGTTLLKKPGAAAAGASGTFLQRSLQFSGKETRDIWFFGLKQVLQERALRGIRERKLPLMQPVPIEEIWLHEPTTQEGAFYCEVEVLGGGRSHTFTLEKQVNLRVYIDEQLWTDVMDFLETNSIVPSEGLSFFKYCKAILERCLMEEWLLIGTKVIDDQYLPRKMERTPDAAMEELFEAAEKTLAELKERLPGEIGYLGLGPAIVEMIMSRNIDKMRLINEKVRANYKVQGA